jgi:transposase
MKKGRAGTMTHDYKRHGVTTLFAALDVLEGKVIGQCMKHHRHQEFIRFLTVIDVRMPKKKTVHVIVDNYAAHKHPKVLEWIGVSRDRRGGRVAVGDGLLNRLLPFRFIPFCATTQRYFD